MKSISKLAIIGLIAFGFIPSSFASVKIDAKKSTFNWKGTKKIGGGQHVGTISLKSATAKVEKDQVVAGEFVMDMNSINVTDLEGKKKNDFLGHMKSDDFFNTEKFPEAKLVITGPAGKDKVKAKLTIRDKTEPIEIQFKKTGNVYTGKLQFDRSKFGVNYGSATIFEKLTLDKVINNEVDLEFNIVTETAPAAAPKTAG